MATIVLQEGLDRAFRDDVSLPMFVVSSAGLADGSDDKENKLNLPVAEHVAELMREKYRIDLSDERSRSVWTLPEYEQAEIIVAATPNVAATLKKHLHKPDAWNRPRPRIQPRILVLNEENGGIPDPIGGSLKDYKDCLEAIERAMPVVVQRIGEIVKKENHESLALFLNTYNK